MNPLPHLPPENADTFFERQLGTSLTAVLLPVPGENPAGASLRGGDTWAAIGAARHADDPTLPLGAWQYELARADWPQASALALDALQHKSKDLQLVAWFFEAQINLNGFAAISPCMVLLQSLCEQFWDSLYPPPDEDGDLSHRANLIRWMGDKFLPVLRQIPLIGIGREREFGWADWEQAHRNEKVQSGNKNNKPVEGVTIAELNFAISATATDAFMALASTLGQALATIEVLNHSMDRLFGEQAPGLAGMSNLLQQIHSFLSAELHKRGVRHIATPEQAPAPSAGLAPVALPEAPAAQSAGESGTLALPLAAGFGGPPSSRADAYARLAETAEFLMRLEPHSPVPYLVRRATEWGSLNTVELYQELFLRLNGQLNIFEMLGLEPAAR